MPRTVLVIDRESQLRNVVAEVMAEDDGSCVTAVDLEAADTLIEMVQLDWIALDLDTADGRAAEWLAKVATARPKLAERTLVVMQPPYQRAVAESLEALGASILMKPLRADRLRIELA